MTSFFMDIRALLFAVMAVAAIECLALILIWLTRKTYPGFGLWTAGNATFSAAFLLIFLRGIIPDVFTIFLANVLLMGGAILYYEGTLRFRQLPSHRIVSAALIFLMAVTIFYFRYVDNLIGVRIIIVSLLLAVVFGLVAWSLLRETTSAQRFTYWLTGSFFTVTAVFMLARAIIVARRPSMHDLFDANFLQTFTFLLPLLLSVPWTFCFFILNSERLESELTGEVIERRTTEEVLKKSEEQVRLLLNSTAEAIYGINLDGNCTFANPSCLRMLGYEDAKQLIGKNMHWLIHHSYPDGSPMSVEECCIFRAFQEGKGMHRDDEVLWKADGTSFPAEYWSYPQIESGKVTGAVVTFNDITERKHAEELLAMEERIRLARDLHDGMLQSLTVAALQLEVVHQQMETDLQGARKRLLEIQQYMTATQRDMRLQIQELKRPLTPAADAPASLTDRLTDLAERTRRNWGLNVEMYVQPFETPVSPQMAQQLYFMINEALTNAVKHAAASTVSVDLASDDRQVRIVIADNGRGFPFHGRYDDASLARMGIGPATLKERIAALEGTLTVESADTGTSLQITVPCRKKEA